MHSTLWDSYNDKNGEVIEELMEIKNLVCLCGRVSPPHAT